MKMNILSKNEMQIIKDLDITSKMIEHIFLKNIESIIYVVNSENEFQGTITLGDYCRNVDSSGNYINYNTVRIWKRGGHIQQCH